MNVHTSRLRCSYVTFYVAIVFYLFWCQRYVSAQYGLTRVCVRVFGEPDDPKARAHTLAPVSAMNGWKRYIAADLMRSACQAFYSASAFNANIGAWNTVRVVDMFSVSAFSAVSCNAAKSSPRSGYKWFRTHVEIEM
jgi:hypothetical protein